MNLSEKIGQMLLFGWQGETPDESKTVNAHAALLIDELAVGGIILMERNISEPKALRAMIDQMQQMSADRGSPRLFVATDQEGGRVNRLNPPHYTRMPSALQIGRTGSTERARAVAKGIGEELLSTGINWDFAPVLDVNNNPHNPVIGDRSYSNDPIQVAAMGVAAVHGFQADAGILACGKHFPGHGDTDVDSHLALPRVAHTKERLHKVELLPFRAAIANGLAAIMTSHIMFPAFDTDLPATISPRILTDLLRDELDFKGLIITDCLEMRGVADRWGTLEAAVLAVEAGADILLSCHTQTTQVAIRDAVLAAVRSGRISEARIDASLARIATAKSRWIPAMLPPIREDGFPEHQELAAQFLLATVAK